MNNLFIAWILLTIPFIGWYCLMLRRKIEPDETFIAKHAMVEAVLLWWGIYFLIK